MRHLTTNEILALHLTIIHQSGGSLGLRDLGALESAISQPRQAFAGSDLYPSLAEKAAALCYSLVCNHPFVDGNKRIGHAAMEAFLILNGYELSADVDQLEELILRLASSKLSREELVTWLRQHMVPFTGT